jgi:hypothetical protein
MRRRVIASLIAIASLSACAHQTPQAMPGMAWSLNNADGEGAKLAFGQANTDNVLVMLTCQPRSGQVMLSANAPNGAKPELQLASRGAQARYVGDVSPDMGEGAVVEAKTHANDPVMANFAKSGDLAVTVAGRRTTVPADRAKAQQFVESCRA